MGNVFQRPKPLVLVIIDGMGVAPPGPGNAISLAKTPILDKYWPKFPHGHLHASGLHVGLPNGVDGNSEVGHMNIGAGKVIFQELPRIDAAIDSETFFDNQALKDAFKKTREGKSVHIIGCVGGGQVHSSYGHLTALLDMAKNEKVDASRLFVHAFTDGRDSPPQSADKYLSRLEIDLKRIGGGRIASVVGRYFAMDRDERWERTRKAYDLIVLGKGSPVKHWKDALSDSYGKSVYDEYLEPYVIVEGERPIATVQDGDSVIFFNYRADRAIQITRAFEDSEFPGWERPIMPNLYFVGMTNYEKGFPKVQAFPPDKITYPLGRVLADNGLKQLRIAESEKYPHVTYFINGGEQVQYPGEDRIEVPSPRDVATYDQKPEMSAIPVTDLLLQKIDEGEYDVYIVNYANPDMVAHTGVLDASVKAVEITDQCLGRIIDKVMSKKGAVVITSDHGNAEEMIDIQTGNIDTKHSTNPVPVLIVKDGLTTREFPFGILADVTPTVLSLLGIQKPFEMTGRDLLV